MAYANGYTYRRSITVDYTKVPNTNQTDFPVLISGTYSYLAHTTHAGLVTDLNGYDIAFYSDAAGATPLYWEIESYNHETGAIVFWVKATLSYVADTVFYMFYTNASVSTFQSTASSVWSNNFLAVWHLGAASGTFADSTGGGHTGTVSGTVTYGAAGAVGLGVAQNSGGRIDAGSNNDIKVNRNWTFSAWINRPSFAAVRSIMGRVYGPYLRTTDAGKLNFLHSSIAQIKTADTTLTINTWYYVGVTLGTGSTASGSIYLSGATDGDFSTSIDFTDVTQNTILGADYAGADPFNGTMDEMRIASTARSADWIATEYANQNAPSTFYLVGSQTESSAYIETYGGTMTGILRGEFRGMMKRLT